MKNREGVLVLAHISIPNPEQSRHSSKYALVCECVFRARGCARLCASASVHVAHSCLRSCVRVASRACARVCRRVCALARVRGWAFFEHSYVINLSSFLQHLHAFRCFSVSLHATFFRVPGCFFVYMYVKCFSNPTSAPISYPPVNNFYSKGNTYPRKKQIHNIPQIFFLPLGLCSLLWLSLL